MKKADFKEFTVDAPVLGPTREVQYTTGDVLVTTPALIIKGVSAADAWQILGMMEQGLFKKTDAEVKEAEPGEKDKGVETRATEEPKKEKKKRRTKAQIKADERKAANDEAKAKAADPNDPTDAPPANGDSAASSEAAAPDSDSPDPTPAPAAEADAGASSQTSTPADKKNGKAKKKKSKAKVGGIDLEQLKSATGLRELVGDFKSAGVESKEQVVVYCTELQGMGLKCLRGVNIERRVSNLWDMVA